MSESPEPARPPTIEDLLRLKRAERPDDAFWHEFDAGLRRKQLAAIVEPRPWWLGLSLLARRVSPPVWAASAVSGGAAALFALVSLNTTASAPDSASARPAVVAATAASAASDPHAHTHPTDGESAAVRPSDLTSPARPLLASAALASAPMEHGPAGSARVGSTDGEAMTIPASPASPQPLANIRHSAAEALKAGAQLAALELPVPRLAQTSDALVAGGASGVVQTHSAQHPAVGRPAPLGTVAHPLDVTLTDLLAASFDLHAWDFVASAGPWVPTALTPQKAGRTAEPASVLADADNFDAALAQVAFAEPAVATTALRETEAPDIDPAALAPRQARLLAVALPADHETEPVARAKDRIVRHLASGDQLYASATRLGVGGDRLSLRF